MRGIGTSGSMAKLIATFFYLGFLPLIPGTFGSLAGIILFYLIRNNSLFYVLFTFVLTALGFVTAGWTERHLKSKDARCIVIDEVSGMLISLVFLPSDIKVVLIAFFLFRILDSLKPYPAGILQRLKGGIGIMSDDIIAGLYTNIILQVVLRLASFRAS